MIVNTGFSFSNQAAGEFHLAGEDNLCAFECQRQQGIASMGLFTRGECHWLQAEKENPVNNNNA